MAMWRLSVGIIFGTIFLGNSVNVYAVGVYETTDKEVQHTASVLPANPNPQSDVIVKHRAYEYPYSCDKPKNAEQDGLCIARKAADAAVDTAKWNKFATEVGIYGTVAVVFTLLVSIASTVIALHSANLSKAAFISAQRAYVFANDLRAFWEIDPKTKRYHWRFRPVWNNGGGTSTKRMRMYTGCMLLNSPLSSGFNFDFNVPTMGRGIIHPKTFMLGGLAPTPPELAISAQDILDVQAGIKYLYLIGWMKYFDVFDEKNEHLTRFCWQLAPVGDPIKKPTELRWDLIHHVEGNCADKECD